MTEKERDEWFTVLGEEFYVTELRRNAKSWNESCVEHLPDVLRRVWDRAWREATEGRLPSGVLLSEERVREITARVATDSVRILIVSGMLDDLLTERQNLIRLLQDSEGLDAYKRGWDARIEYGEEDVLGNLSPGDLFVFLGGRGDYESPVNPHHSTFCVADHVAIVGNVYCTRMSDGFLTHWSSREKVRKVTVKW